MWCVRYMSMNCVNMCVFWWVVTKTLKCYTAHTLEVVGICLPQTLYLYPLWKAHVSSFDGMQLAIHNIHWAAAQRYSEMLVHGGESIDAIDKDDTSIPYSNETGKWRHRAIYYLIVCDRWISPYDNQCMWIFEIFHNRIWDIWIQTVTSCINNSSYSEQRDKETWMNENKTNEIRAKELQLMRLARIANSFSSIFLGDDFD